jgi:hypothetical protein
VTNILPTVELPVSLPDPRPSDPLEALSWLGETEEEVVRALRERGIKGIRRAAGSCPLAAYLRLWWDHPSVWQTVSAWSEESDTYHSHDTPRHCFAFACHFDSGLYPDLIADD